MIPDLQKGTELAGRYTLLRTLGTGADTQTWLATDRMTRASVALKIRRGERISPEVLRKEWQTSLRLMHSHIVRVFEFHDEPGCTFYSLQFIDGADISALSGAPLADVLPSLALLADALRYVHRKGLVHRDIKASNVLLDRNGAPYLSDFGAAIFAETSAAGGSLIAASPQSIDGAAASPADDIFALGGLIYELVAGRSPYSSANTADDIRHVTPPTLIAASGEPISPDLQALLQSMLAMDAAVRPDAATVVQQLSLAGYPGAPAPAKYVGGAPTAGPEIIAAQTQARSKPTLTVKSGAAATTQRSSGISARTLGISLAVLLVILLGVVFILPNTVPDDSVPGQGEDAVAGTTEVEPQAIEAAPPATPGRDERVVARGSTEAILGQLLSMMATLESRAVQRWGGLRYKQAQEIYAAGDAAYLLRDYATASDHYREAIAVVEPLLDEVDAIFASTYAAAGQALENANTADALRLFELAAAISSGHAGAQAGLVRARNLDTVLSLTEQGLAFERNLELSAARQNFERAVTIDPEWQPAQDALARVTETLRQMEFDLRMTEGLNAIADAQFEVARAAFRMAQALDPASPEPADGLMQVDQEIHLDRIRVLEQQAQTEEQNEQWETAVETYESILEIDTNLVFAQQGLVRAQQMLALHNQLETYIADPDGLSAPATMRRATTLVVDITRMPVVGARLADQRDELSRLLKRAATPLRVELVSDNATDVSVYKVAKLGHFAAHALELRPGKYVVVGSRPGFRDVRIEFSVGPEIEAKPIVVRCEEAI
ncbi:MAG: protein kinase [Proteobacteria bacterium]|nr:protein kinase [Pseudomonadota bacterium]